MTEIRSRKLERQFKRHLGREDADAYIAEISKMLRALPTGNDVDAYCAFLDKFDSFISSIDTAYSEYEDRFKIASRSLEISTAELNEVNRNLERLNGSINAMLDSLGQGLLFFGANGVVSDVYSRACVNLLNEDPAGKVLWDLLRLPAESAGHMQKWLTFLFMGDSALDFDDLKYLAPSEFVNRHGKIIELDYKPMKDSAGKLQSVLMIATDCTDQRRFLQELKDSQDEAAMIIQIAQNRNGFYRFINNMTQFVETTVEAGDITFPDVTMRDLHTFKGTAASFSMRAVAQTLDDLETTLKMMRTDRAMLRNFATNEVKSLQPHINALIAHGRALFGEDFINEGQVRTIEVDAIYDLIDVTAGKIQDPALREEIISQMNRRLLTVPLQTLMQPFRIELIRIAEQQGKPQPHYVVTGDSLPVIAADYSEFVDSLVHVARNIMDHAIEPEQERIQKGKEPAGTVVIDIQRIQNPGHKSASLVMSITDDGRGIDPEIIRVRLKAKGVANVSDDDTQVLQHIFDDDFSTRATVGGLSGRGVGLAAVRDSVTRTLGGTVHVESHWIIKNEGTTFVFTIPYKIG